MVVDAAAAAAASRSDGRPTDEGVLPECGGELDHFVSAKCAAWMYRMRRSSTFGKGARWVCALSLAGRAGCGAGSGIQTCAHGGRFLDCHPINFATQLISKILTRIRDYWERDKERERGAMKGS